ncbi:hypothetical protein ABBQ32_008448 [Trebouxia sp. C0010 RCD-2024]
MAWTQFDKFKSVKVKQESRHAIVVLARPSKSNALDDTMWTELPQVFEALDKMDDVYAIVLGGEGKNFCAGIDTASLEADFINPSTTAQCPARVRERLLHRIKSSQHTINAIELCRWPVIAAVQGACFGAGIDIITACDIRYSTNAATFCVKEVDVAIVADVGTLQRLPTIVGQGIASELSLTARVIKGEEAKQMGLVTQCFADETALLQHAHSTAELLAAKSPLATIGTKRVLIHARDHSVSDSLDYVAAYNAAMLPSRDIQEVFSAVVKGRRQPRFSKL